MYSLDDTDGLGVNAPRPLDADTVDKGGFKTISQGDGAVRARRDASAEAGRNGSLPMPKRTLAVLAVAALAVIALCVALFVRVLSAPVPGSDVLEDDAAPVGAQDANATAQAGSSYELREDKGSYSLVEVRTEVLADGQEEVQEVLLGNLPGAPVDLIMFGDTVLLPENLSDGTWEVSAYTMGSGWSPISDQSGAAVGGQGTITEAALDGTTLRLVVDGAAVEVPLEW